MDFAERRKKLLAIFGAALEAAEGSEAVRRHMTLEGGHLSVGGRSFRMDAFERVVALGAGKATARMARGAEIVLGGLIDEGLVIVKDGHREALDRIEVVEAAHPVPDTRGLEATKRIMEIARRADEKTLVINLLSGGASALLVCPAGMGLEEMRTVTQLLLSAGADIFELNAVRKHLSMVKGGRLAELASPATLVTLIISDVPGRRLDTIASGPTAPDPTTYADALGVLEKYRLTKRVPEAALRVLTEGKEGRLPETPKGGEEFFKRTLNVIVAGPEQALEGARKEARSLGFRIEIDTEPVTGEARGAARLIARKAAALKRGLSEPLVSVSGGETTVTVKGPGRGGRNQELALAFAIEIEGMGGITLLSSATDGTDGPTEMAGAVVDGETAREALEAGLDPREYLERNDSYTFFKRLDEALKNGHHIYTGPTGTNVMDLQVLLLEP